MIFLLAAAHRLIIKDSYLLEIKPSLKEERERERESRGRYIFIYHSHNHNLIVQAAGLGINGHLEHGLWHDEAVNQSHGEQINEEIYVCFTP